MKKPYRDKKAPKIWPWYIYIYIAKFLNYGPKCQDEWVRFWQSRLQRFPRWWRCLSPRTRYIWVVWTSYMARYGAKIDPDGSPDTNPRAKNQDLRQPTFFDYDLDRTILQTFAVPWSCFSARKLLVWVVWRSYMARKSIQPPLRATWKSVVSNWFFVGG